MRDCVNMPFRRNGRSFAPVSRHGLQMKRVPTRFVTSPPFLPASVFLFAVAITFWIPFHHTRLPMFCVLCIVGFVALLWNVFLSSAADRLALSAKAFFLVIVVPPLCLLVGQLLLGGRPHLVYPSSLRLNADYGPHIEAISYGTALAFSAAFLAGASTLCGYRKTEAKTLNAHRSNAAGSQGVPMVFWFLILQGILYSSFQMIGGSLALLHGGYGLSDNPHPLGVNCWNAMGTLCLVLASGFRNRRDRTSQLILCMAGLYIVGVNLLNGNRADIIGLALLGAVMAARRRLRISGIASATIIVVLTAVLAIVVAGYRAGYGLSGEEAQLRSVVHYEGFWYFPSINDFFGSLPMTVSYVEYDNGELWCGRTYLICLTCLLPSSINPWRINESATTHLIENYCRFNGGMYFPAELWINFGIVGVLLAAPLLGRLLTWTERHLTVDPASPHVAIVYSMIVGFPRWVLYGSSTFTKQLFLISIFWLMASLLARECGFRLGAWRSR